jgi:hypothetical protein
VDGYFQRHFAVTAVAALWYARDQIKETREESEVQIKEARQQAQIQHLLTLVNEFDQEPMATYRRGFAQERLSHKDEEVQNSLQFDWVIDIDADSDMRPNIEYEKLRIMALLPKFLSHS